MAKSNHFWWLNPCVVFTLWKQLKTTYSASWRFSQEAKRYDYHRLPIFAALLYEIIKQQPLLILEPHLLQPLESWFERLLRVKCFMKVFHQTFVYHSLHITLGNVYSGNVDMFTGWLTNGGVFSLWVSSILASKAIEGVFFISRGQETRNHPSNIRME